MSLAVLAEVVRSGFVEGSHHGSVVILDGALRSLGQPDQPVLPRSANKPLQAVGLLELGWEPADDRQLALAAASHSGEDVHLDVVRRILADAWLSPEALHCPPLLPLSEPAAHALLASGAAATPLTHNCSGKHAAMLATCVANGWPTGSYLDQDHPLQQALTATIACLAGEPVRHIAVDGCGAPQHALTLTGLARSYGALVTAPAGSASRRVADAMRAHPDLVGGDDRDVTLLMRAVPGLLAKDGAEGVYAAAMDDGSAVAVKIQDGGSRARMPVLVAALRSLGAAGAGLDALATVPVFGGGRPVGEVRASAGLVAALAGEPTAH